MAGWQLDTRRFAEEVFVPVREGWDISRNLFRFFQLPLDVSDDGVLDQAVRSVDAHLKRNSLAGVHAAVASSLRPTFAEHAATVRETARRAQHRAQVLADRRSLVEQVRADLRDMPALRTTQLDELAARVRSRFVRREVEEALHAAGITVRDPVPLAVPRPPRWAETRLPLRTLGHTGLAEYLAARKLTAGATDADLARVRGLLDRSRTADALTAEETVLGAVERLVAAGTLADALRRELVDELCEAAEHGTVALGQALGRPDTARRAAALGLPAGDDLAYAVLCRVRPVGPAEARWREDVEQALAAGELRTAFDILTAKPNLPPDLADMRLHLESELARVADGLAAAAALEDRDPEAAAVRYVAVLRIARDPAAEDGLRRCRPPAPPAAAARVEGDRVAVSWEPAPVRAGDPRYRVVRRVDAMQAGSRTEVAETSETFVIDTAAPAGTAVVYEVSTLRTGASSATPAVTAPVVVLRPVTGLVADPGDGEVRLRWRLPDGAVAARVRRAGDDGRVVVPAGTTTAHDSTARSGLHYTYAVEAAYDRGGTREFAPAAVIEAHPQAPPDAVDDLRIAEEPDGTAVASWTPPGHGVVMLRAEHRPPPAPGTLVRADAEVGDVVQVLGRAPVGLRILLPADGRRRWLVPLTVAGELAVVGRAVEHDPRLLPVTDLRAARQGRQLRLSWEWPPRAAEARVLVREGYPVDGPGDPRAAVVRISRAVFERAGCRVLAAPGVEQWVAVGLCAQDDGQEVFGPLVQVAVHPPAAARYTVLPARRGRRTLVVIGSPPLPAVELRARVAFPPLRRDEGDLVATVRPDAPDADRMSVEFPLARGRPLHLRAFAADPADELELVPDDPEQLRVDRGRWW